jgi:acetoin utilization protein AcuB
VQGLAPETDIVDAVTAMLAQGVRHLPVVNELGRVVGMVSESDLRTALGAALPRSGGGAGQEQTMDVGSVMTPRAIVAHEDASLFELAGRFIHERVGAVPVIDDAEQLVGVVSHVDLLRYLLGEAHVASA